MQRQSYVDRIRINKRHWDSLAVIDWPKKAEMRKKIRDDYPYLENVEPKIAPYLRNVRGKKIVVLQFGDALVLLACAKRGAVVTGIDFSSEQVRVARKSAAYCGVNVNLLQADCQNLPRTVPSAYFDFAIAECGIFIWIQKLDAWMKNAHRVLKKGGRLIVSDFHPLSLITEEKDGTWFFTRSYYDHGPRTCEHNEGVPPGVEFLWKLSDIINEAADAGFRIDHMDEFYVQNDIKGIPFFPSDFLLVATKH
jgi:ubiquinone/menaquinone biosynthesis C-methylase UbiE